MLTRYHALLRAHKTIDSIIIISRSGLDIETNRAVAQLDCRGGHKLSRHETIFRTIDYQADHVGRRRPRLVFRKIRLSAGIPCTLTDIFPSRCSWRIVSVDIFAKTPRRRKS